MPRLGMSPFCIRDIDKVYKVENVDVYQEKEKKQKKPTTKNQKMQSHSIIMKEFVCEIHYATNLL